jgi:hypothetical protein
MKLARLVGLPFIAVLAVSAMVASPALAVKSEFKVLPSSTSFSGASGSGTLTAGTNVVTCSKDSNNGTITSMDTVGKVTVTFTGCSAAGKGGSGCTIKSIGAGAGEIVTNALKGELGTSKEAKSEVGLILEPETTKKFVTLVSTKCTEVETTVSGSVAGEVETTSKLQTTGKVNFSTSSGKQVIKAITVLSGSKKPELEAFGLSATEATEDILTFASNTEVV